MKKYKILSLTDHKKHSKENSIYALMTTLLQHPQCAKLDIASRGNQANDAFFHQLSTTKLYASAVDSPFSFQDNGQQFIEDQKLVQLEEYDLIILRLPRPVTTEFMLYLAEKAKEALLINHPLGIEKTSTKAYLLGFPELCPSIRLCHSIEEIMDFGKQFPIVLKPLKEYGGKGILKIEGQTVYDGNTPYPALDYLSKIKTQIETEGYLAMKFLKNVSQGDKRILVVNGQILAASLRLPAKDSWLCNVAQGGSSVPAQVTAEEVAIIEKIAPPLLQEGIVIFGADTLVDDDGKRILSEINTLSIGGFPQAEEQTGKPILQQTINNIFEYVNKQRG